MAVDAVASQGLFGVVPDGGGGGGGGGDENMDALEEAVRRERAGLGVEGLGQPLAAAGADQAMATWATSAALLSAIFRRASTRGRLRSRFSLRNRGLMPWSPGRRRRADHLRTMRATTLASALTTATPTPRDAAAVYVARMCDQQSHQRGEEEHQAQFLVVAVLKTGSSEVRSFATSGVQQ
ncbi:hypothetical protein GCM10010317_093190 [Streptomyces mirabilis]|uniref:hypothetical protein n=1 Tax=Streptomyces mirabilis TaxID=68239 RepID=UPI00167D16BE|nr:hypothetical protein GCM10010317_093190 [Streptomyces mirabilis]